MWAETVKRPPLVQAAYDLCCGRDDGGWYGINTTMEFVKQTALSPNEQIADAQFMALASPSNIIRLWEACQRGQRR